MVASAAIASPIPKPNSTAAFVDVQTGALTPHGLTLLTQWHARMVGTSRLIPCNASGKNIITLTPIAPAPSLDKYESFDVFVFVADETSDGPVTAKVVPKKGTLATIKAFKTDGASQADTGDVVAGSVYLAVYVDTLDTAAGGLVLK